MQAHEAGEVISAVDDGIQRRIPMVANLLMMIEHGLWDLLAGGKDLGERNFVRGKCTFYHSGHRDRHSILPLPCFYLQLRDANWCAYRSFSLSSIFRSTIRSAFGDFFFFFFFFQLNIQ